MANRVNETFMISLYSILKCLSRTQHLLKFTEGRMYQLQNWMLATSYVNFQVDAVGCRYNAILK